MAQPPGPPEEPTAPEARGSDLDPTGRLDATTQTDQAHGPHPLDPIVARRRQIGRWAERGQRLGYSLYGLALLLFLVAMVTDLPRVLVGSVVVAMMVGSVVLAPSIVAGYGVRAADREDRERAATSGDRR